MREGIDALVEMGAAVARQRTESRDDGIELVERWIQSPAPLLRRLAVDALASATFVSGEERLNWVLDHGLLHDPGVKPEVFRLLQRAYAEASPGMRRRILDAAKRASFDDPSEDARGYELYNLLGWLEAAAPDDDATREAFDEIQAENPEYRRREHPELDVGPIETRVGLYSPKSADELRRSPPDESLITYLLTFEGDGTVWGHEREGLLLQVAEAVASAPGWGIELAEVLSDRDTSSADLWGAILQGWGRSLQPRSARRVLDLIRQKQSSHIAEEDVARFLSDWSRATPAKALSMKTASAGRLLAQETWDRLSVDSDRHLGEPDALTAAINTAGGHLAQAVAYLLSAEWQSENIDRVPPRYARLLDRMTSASGVNAEAARVFLCSQVHFFLALDEVWTKRALIPLFDWSATSALTAGQVWQGYLIWGRLNERLLALMLPLYLQSVPRLANQSLEWRDQFTRHLSIIATQGTRDPLDAGWLFQFVSTSEDADRARWASHVMHDLNQAGPEASDIVWEKWMGRYWRSRADGIPKIIGEAEAGPMAGWVTTLGKDFREAAELSLELPPPRVDSFVFGWLGKSPGISAEPVAAGRFLAWLLRGQGFPFYQCPEVIEIRDALSASGQLTGAVDQDLEEQLRRLSCIESG